MKKIFVYLFMAIVLLTFGWTSNAKAGLCDDAVFDCKLQNGSVLGTVSITCSMQFPFNELFPRCLPDIPISNIFKPLDDCNAKYGNTVYQACPKQSWPSGYGYSSCMRYPG